MHDGSQISNKRGWDASHSRDFRERIRDCIVCGYKPPSKASFDLHRRNCKECLNRALLIGDFVKCPYCEYASSILSHHLKKTHQIDNKMSKEMSINTHSVNMRKRNGEAVSRSIMSNPTERQRRSKLLGHLNKTDEFRKKASETAIETSARPDIQAQRSMRLKRWRENNPEEFREKCWEKMILATPFKMSKPEMFMRKWLQHAYPQKFKYSQFLYSKKYKEIGNMSGRKQIDFVDSCRQTYIEIDGPFHFEGFNGRKGNAYYIERGFLKTIPKTIEKDRITETILSGRNKCLIRIGYGCWADSTGRINQETLDKVKEIIDNKQIGIFKLGEEYGEDNCI